LHTVYKVSYINYISYVSALSFPSISFSLQDTLFDLFVLVVPTDYIIQSVCSSPLSL